MGWMFRTLDLIMDLAPKFETAAEVGPITLSVIADDIEGATALFEKSLRNFPNNWIIAYRAAYHYMVELEDSHRAADLFMQAYRNGAPEWTPLLAAKLQQKVGRLEVAKLILEDFLKQDLQGLENIEAAEKKMKELNRILKKRGD